MPSEVIQFFHDNMFRFQQDNMPSEVIQFFHDNMFRFQQDNMPLEVLIDIVETHNL